MTNPRLTHNAVTAFRRGLRPSDSISSAHQALRQACRAARYLERPPSWLRHARTDNEGYLLLDGELAVLPIRGGRAVACLVNPTTRG